MILLEKVPHGVVANVLVWDVVGSQIKFQSRYSVHFRAKYPWKMYGTRLLPQLMVK